MNYFFDLEDIKILKTCLRISNEKLAEKMNYSVRGLKYLLSGETPIDVTKILEMLSALISLKENPEKEFRYPNAGGGLLDEAVTRMKMKEAILEDIKAHIEKINIKRLYQYWENINFYLEFGTDVTSFLYNCFELKNENGDKRNELLEYMNGFSCSLKGINSVLFQIQRYCNFRDDHTKRLNVNFEKSRFWKSDEDKNIQKAEQIYRAEIENSIRDILYKDDHKMSVIVYQQIKFIPQMDDVDWSLLISYTFAQADDEGGEKVKQIHDKLESLIE